MLLAASQGRRRTARFGAALSAVLLFSAPFRAAGQSLVPTSDGGGLLPAGEIELSIGGRVFDAGRVPDGLFAYPALVEGTRAVLRVTGPDLDRVVSVRFRRKDEPASKDRVVKRPKGYGVPRGVFDVHLGEKGELSIPEPLAVDTRYVYAVETPSGSATGELMTAPPDGADVRFLVYGDNRSDAVSHRRIALAMARRERDLLVHTGDYVEVGPRDDQWTTFFAIERELLASRFLVGSVGNHELIDPKGANYLRFFAKEDSDPTSLHVERRGFVRTVRWGRAHLFLLVGMDDGGVADERAWLAKELDRSLEEAPAAFRIVVLHHGPWSSGPHGSNARLFSSGIVDLLAEKKVDLILAGHDHLYERGASKGIAYVISGGGGAPLYNVKRRIPEASRSDSVHHFLDVSLSDGKLEMEAVRDDLSTLDTCTLVKGSGRWDCKGDPPSTGGDAGGTPPIVPESSEGRFDPAVVVFGTILAIGAALFFGSRRKKKALPDSGKSDKNPK